MRCKVCGIQLRPRDARSREYPKDVALHAGNGMCDTDHAAYKRELEASRDRAAAVAYQEFRTARERRIRERQAREHRLATARAAGLIPAHPTTR